MYEGSITFFYLLIMPSIRTIMRRCFFLLCVTSVVSGMSCSKEFEEHYNPRTKGEKNIFEVLEEDPELPDFVKVI